jgi:trigger factor
MQVSVDKISDLERKLTVQVPAEQVDSQVEERLKSMAPRTKVHGFRPGKVPLRVVRQMYGKQVREEVLGDLIQASFVETVQKEQLRPAGGPQVERQQDAPGQAFEYSATFEIYPEVELAPLEELEVTRVSATITDADVDRVVENMRRQRTQWEGAERPAAEGDRVDLGFEGRIDGEPFPGGLIGASAGDRPTLDLTFPTDYPSPELAGKAAQFAVEVKGVSRPVLPELDETFFISFGIAEGGRESFFDAVKQNMARELEQATRGRVKSELFDRLLAANPVCVPR